MYTEVIIILICMFLFCVEVSTLRNARVISPQAVRRGSDVTIQCIYDLEGDTLYSVKWYKDDREFCRFIPRDGSRLKVFPTDGIDVNIDESDAVRLSLRDVTHTTSGRYVCEVSADAPSFHTSQVNFTLHVVDIPESAPTIHGIKSGYNIGEILRGNCTSKNSNPPANVTWFLNEAIVRPEYTHNHVYSSYDRLYTTISSINFLVTTRHFHRGKLKIRCTSNIYDVYRRNDERIIELNRVGSSDVTRRDPYNGVLEHLLEKQLQESTDTQDEYVTSSIGKLSEYQSFRISANYYTILYFVLYIYLI